MKPSSERFKTKYIPVTESGCWLWLGAVHPIGYAQFYYKGGTYLAHRYSYEYYKGPIPDKLQIDHLCRVRSCVNPDHLEVVTAKVNMSRGHNKNKAKTHCPKGHEYTTFNTYTSPKGYRHCIKCRTEYNKTYMREYRLR